MCTHCQLAHYLSNAIGKIVELKLQHEQAIEEHERAIVELDVRIKFYQELELELDATATAPFPHSNSSP